MQLLLRQLTLSHALYAPHCRVKALFHCLQFYKVRCVNWVCQREAKCAALHTATVLWLGVWRWLNTGVAAWCSQQLARLPEPLCLPCCSLLLSPHPSKLCLALTPPPQPPPPPHCLPVHRLPVPAAAEGSAWLLPGPGAATVQGLGRHHICSGRAGEHQAHTVS